MTDKERNLVLKFLNLQYGDLIEVDHQNGKYLVLTKKGSDVKIFFKDKVSNECYVRPEFVIYPIINMFKTEYQETYELIKNWLEEKYHLVCDELIGLSDL